jgi:hypothetical protein
MIIYVYLIVCIINESIVGYIDETKTASPLLQNHGTTVPKASPPPQHRPSRRCVGPGRRYDLHDAVPVRVGGDG